MQFILPLRSFVHVWTQSPRLPGTRRHALALALVALLGACSTSALRPAVYDFGPGPVPSSFPASRAESARSQALLPPLLLADVDATSALDGSAVLYRLLYSDSRQLRPYAQARWSMAPAQLLRLRLREQLGQRRSVLSPGDALAPGTLVLRLELEECSQLFASAQASSVLLRVRATLSRSVSPAKALAQTSFVVQRPAASPDAAGGVQALALATDELIQQLDAWLQQAGAAESAP